MKMKSIVLGACVISAMVSVADIARADSDYISDGSDIIVHKDVGPKVIGVEVIHDNGTDTVLDLPVTENGFVSRDFHIDIDGDSYWMSMSTTVMKGDHEKSDRDMVFGTIFDRDKDGVVPFTFSHQVPKDGCQIRVKGTPFTLRVSVSHERKSGKSKSHESQDE